MHVRQAVQRDPVMGFWPSVLLGSLWYQGEQTTHFQETNTFWGLAAEGGKAKKPIVSGKCVVFGLGTPGLEQKPLGQKAITGSL